MDHPAGVVVGIIGVFRRWLMQVVFSSGGDTTRTRSRAAAGEAVLKSMAALASCQFSLRAFIDPG